MSLFPFHFFKVGDEFLGNYSTVRGSSIGKEASLARPYQILEKGFDPIHNDLSDQLVNGITELYRPKIPKTRSASTFRNKTDEGFVNIIRNAGAFKDLPAKGYCLVSQDVLIFLAMYVVKTIKAQGFHGLEGFKGYSDLTSP